MSYADMAQFLGMAATVLGGIMGYGRLQERVQSHTEQLAIVPSKDFQDEVLRRLERIEKKQDSLTGQHS